MYLYIIFFIFLNMANVLLFNILFYIYVVAILVKLQNTMKKLQNKASSIALMKKFYLLMLYLYLQKTIFKWKKLCYTISKYIKKSFNETNPRFIKFFNYIQSFKRAAKFQLMQFLCMVIILFNIKSAFPTHSLLRILFFIFLASTILVCSILNSISSFIDLKHLSN